MRLKVLGCVSPVCTKEDNLSGYLLTMDKEKILLDCGSGITKEMNFPEDLNNLTIIISHLHPDHYVDIFNIINLIKEYKRKAVAIPKITLYIPSKPRKIYKLILEKGENVLNIKKYNERTVIKGVNYIVNFCKVKHSDEEAYATKVSNNYNSFVYTGDASNFSTEKLVTFSKNSNVILCDASFLRSEGKSDDPYHMTVHEASNYARLAEAGKLILTHLSSVDRDDDKIILEAANNFENAELAKTGKEFNIW